MNYEVSSEFTPLPSKPTENCGLNSDTHFVQITTIQYKPQWRQFFVLVSISAYTFEEKERLGT